MILILLAALQIFMFKAGDPPAPGNGTGTADALLQMIEEVVGEGSRPWAKPITEIDAGRIEELVDRGILVFHRAMWAVEREDDE